MNKFSWFLLIFIIVGGALGVALWSNSQGQQPVSVNQETSMVASSPAVMPENQPTQLTNPGSYVLFSSEVLAQSTAPRRVLFFYANWCPTCKPADESFSQNQARIPSDVTVIRVNYNDTETDQDEKDLAEKYGITYQHTFVQIDEQGNEITKWNGGTIDELLSNLK